MQVLHNILSPFLTLPNLKKEIARYTEPDCKLSIEETKEKLSQFQHLYCSLTNAESASRAKVGKRIDDFTALVKLQEIKEDFPGSRIISNKIFTILDKMGLPRLAPILTDKGDGEFIVKASREYRQVNVEFEPKDFPWEFREIFNPTKQALQGKLKKRTKKTFTFTFSGVIPKESRELILRAEKSRHFDHILLAADTTGQWKVDERPLPPPSPDPLIIGMRGEVLYLLGSFDMTIFETWLSYEMTTT